MRWDPEETRIPRLIPPLFLLLFFVAPLVVEGRPGPRVASPKPDPSDAAATARCTISADLQGAPFGNVVSFSDGLPGKGCGIPDALKDERASFTVSEYPVGSCGGTDPENPTCAKLTLTEKLKSVDGDSAEGQFAKSALFAKHNHNFQIFRLDIENIFLIDWFGGPKPLSLDQYLNPSGSSISV
ncbi:unnamed protein product [Spirodela intermedia]|uniref:CREG-like beta-barrel domain-containing protein n=2 Tax=Spirodela intermedia TaxID=51605 RepID=A0A7I8JQR7_SPIIN|nr:unnamed protein product [Spirodela intermedia]CAA6672517.1 unnamed protein product [Spirodela intermedia]CAA7409741.1 unnamed protein product [Spirodela intermedia]